MSLPEHLRRATLADLWCQPFTRRDGTQGHTDGYRVVAFGEAVCRATKGKHAGERIVLRDWQVQLILEIFEVDREGRRLYRRGLIGMPRKNGKSMLGAVIALYGLVADGEPGAEVYSCAGDREQAKIVFNEARRMVELSPELAAELTVNISSSTIAHQPSGSTYKALSAEAYTKEGLNPSMVIFDEVHVQPNGDLWTVMSMGSATRERALILGITTAGFNKATLCGRLYDQGRNGAAFIDGAWRNRKRGFLFCWYEPEDGMVDHRDPAVWPTCNPGFGDFLIASAVHDELAGSEALTENQFRRYRLNQWTTSVEAWLPHGAWDGRAVGRRLEPLEVVCLGLDGSFSDDSTAVIACTVDGFLAVLGVWEKQIGVETWRVPIAAVEACIIQAAKDYSVREVAFDPFRWQRTAQALEDAGLPMVEWPTTSPARMVPATKQFFDGVMDGTISHDGNGVLARHIANARLKTDRLGPRIVKEHKHSQNKIDAAVAAVIAYDRAMRQDAGDDSFNIW